MRDSFSGKILNWDEVQVRDIVQETESGRYYSVVSKEGKVIDMQTKEYFTLEDAKAKQYNLVWYPVISKRSEETLPPATLVTEKEIKSQMRNSRPERKYPDKTDQEKEIIRQKVMDEHKKAMEEFYILGFRSDRDRIEVKTYSPGLIYSILNDPAMKIEIKTYIEMKINRKYKAFELLEFLKDKKNMYLRISEVVQPFDQKLMISFSSVTGEHEGIVISENNQAELIFNDHIYRLVQICKINKNQKP